MAKMMEFLLRPILDRLVTQRLVMFHNAMIARGQIPLPPAQMSADELTRCTGAGAS